jgi:hypothetical protein
VKQLTLDYFGDRLGNLSGAEGISLSISIRSEGTVIWGHLFRKMLISQASRVSLLASRESTSHGFGKLFAFVRSRLS